MGARAQAWPLALAALAALALPAGADPQRLAPRDAVEAFHAALARGDRSGALALLLPTVGVFEEGGVERSRDEYASRHLDADIEFARTTRREVRERWDELHGDVAWVTSRVALDGSFRGRPVAHELVETMLLLRGAEGWRIAHVHWSSRAAPR